MAADQADAAPAPSRPRRRRAPVVAQQCQVGVVAGGDERRTERRVDETVALHRGVERGAKHRLELVRRVHRPTRGGVDTV
jgi:anti-sigma-K factor RskA